jgi:hypothetical protein
MPRYTGPAMDLANMRSLGVTAIDVYCACGHQSLSGRIHRERGKHRLSFAQFPLDRRTLFVQWSTLV